MSDAKATAIIVALLASGGAGAYLLTRKPTQKNYVLTLNGPTSVQPNTAYSYSGTLTLNGSPVSGATISISVNNGTPVTAITDSNGLFKASITFTSTGTYTVNATSNGASASLTVTSSSSAPPPTCSSCSDCPSGYNCVNGQCVQLIPASINAPVSFTVPSGFAQVTLMQNYYPPDPFPVSANTALAISPNQAKFCPSSPLPGSPLKYTITVEIKGKVVDASGAGINGVSVSGSVSGGGDWIVHASGGQDFSGSSTPSLGNSPVTTDCNGNFTLTVDIGVSVTYNDNNDGYNTGWYNMGLQPVTLQVSSGALSSVNTIITFDEYVSAEICNYAYGVLT